MAITDNIPVRDGIRVVFYLNKVSSYEKFNCVSFYLGFIIL